jgi:cellulose synthase (UDP-forming)
MGWAEGRPTDTPLRGLSHVLLVGVRGIAGLFEHLYEDLRGSMRSRPIDVKKLETKKD